MSFYYSFSLSVKCFLVCLSLFNSSSFTIPYSCYSRVTLILHLFTHSPSSSTCYLCLIYHSSATLLFLCCLFFALSLFMVHLIWSFWCCLVLLSPFFHLTISLTFPSPVSPPSFYSLSLCLHSFLILCRSL